MTENEKYEIAVLAEDVANKWQALEMHRALNVYGRPAEELSRMTIAYELAKTEWMYAKAKLEAAQQRIAHQSS